MFGARFRIFLSQTMLRFFNRLFILKLLDTQGINLK